MKIIFYDWIEHLHFGNEELIHNTGVIRTIYIYIYSIPKKVVSKGYYVLRNKMSIKVLYIKMTYYNERSIKKNKSTFPHNKIHKYSILINEKN
jgi:hypothetical protein